MRNIRAILFTAAAIMLASCASKKHVTTEPTAPVTTQEGPAPASNTAELLHQQQMAFVRKVNGNATQAQNVTAKIDFNLKSGSKDITVGGKLMMRRDDVIRIQLSIPIVGMEAGRLEFTKDYVMIVDRIHSEYIKGDYNQIDFLKNNGINFYSLQALFWNMLFVPGQQNVDEAALNNFAVDLKPSETLSTVSLAKNNMSYQWQADSQSGLIRQTNVEYGKGKTGNTKVTCSYGDFRAFAGKQFPGNITLDMMTSATKTAKQIKIGIKMKSIGSDSDWETRTNLSKKYKAVSVDDVLKKIMSL